MHGYQIQNTVALTLAASLALGALPANAQDVHWNMQSAFPGSLWPYGQSGIRFAERVKEMSGGRFVVDFQEPGALANFDAVSTGQIEAVWTAAVFNEGSLGSAVNFFSAVPFGPEFGEFRAWKLNGGGQELREDLYGAHGVTAIDSFCVSPESSGWFRTEIVSLDQFEGLRMRIAGISARVLQKLGVSVVQLRGSEIVPAFERGDIDAADFAMPAVDIDFGFHRVAKYNYYPGWHQRTTCGEILIHKAAYDALPDAYKAIIKTAAAEQGSATYAETEGQNFAAMRKLRDDHGVNILRWSDEALKRFEAAWIEVVAEESAADPEFKKVAERYFAFRDRYRIWGDAQSLERTYQEDPASSSPHTLPLFLSADDPRKRQGFVRIINRSDRNGIVDIIAIDDTGRPFGPVSLPLAPMQTRHFNSGDLEGGEPEKGLSRGVGDGSGNWRLELSTALDIEALAYIRTDDGFLTSIHEVAVEAGHGSMRYHVPFFNPAKNMDQRSSLRLINPGDSTASVVLTGRDDKGDAPRGGHVSLVLDPGAAVTLTAQQLEQGGEDFIGSFDAGHGKWQLTVSANRPVDVMSLLLSPTGHLTNLSQ